MQNKNQAYFEASYQFSNEDWGESYLTKLRAEQKDFCDANAFVMSLLEAQIKFDWNDYVKEL